MLFNFVLFSLFIFLIFCVSFPLFFYFSVFYFLISTFLIIFVKIYVFYNHHRNYDFIFDEKLFHLFNILEMASKTKNKFFKDDVNEELRKYILLENFIHPQNVNNDSYIKFLRNSIAHHNFYNKDNLNSTTEYTFLHDYLKRKNNNVIIDKINNYITHNGNFNNNILFWNFNSRRTDLIFVLKLKKNDINDIYEKFKLYIDRNYQSENSFFEKHGNKYLYKFYKFNISFIYFIKKEFLDVLSKIFFYCFVFSIFMIFSLKVFLLYSEFDNEFKLELTNIYNKILEYFFSGNLKYFNNLKNNLINR